MGLDLQEIVDLASDMLGQPALLEDRDFNLVAFHRQSTTAIDGVRQRSILERGSSAETRAWFESFGIRTTDVPVSTPPDHQRGTVSRLCIPARWNNVNYGYLWVLDPHGHAAALPAVPKVQEIAAHAGALLAQRSMSRYNSSQLLIALLSPDMERSVDAADQLVAQDLVRKSDALTVIEVRTDVPQDAAVVNAWALPRHIISSVTEQQATLLVPLPDRGEPSDAVAVGAQVRQQHEARVGARQVRPLSIGIGLPQDSLRDARVSHRQALLAARIAGTPGHPSTLMWSDLGVYRLLGCKPTSALSAAILDEKVMLLLDCGDDDLIRTASVYLDEAGSIQRSAAALRVHRQTIYHRLQRIEHLTGLDLQSGSDRTMLHLGLTLAPMLV